VTALNYSHINLGECGDTAHVEATLRHLLNDVDIVDAPHAGERWFWFNTAEVWLSNRPRRHGDGREFTHTLLLRPGHEEAAIHLYETLAAATPWRLSLLLATDDDPSRYREAKAAA
jgi:hypothetical protein